MSWCLGNIKEAQKKSKMKQIQHVQQRMPFVLLFCLKNSPTDCFNTHRQQLLKNFLHSPVGSLLKQVFFCISPKLPSQTDVWLATNRTATVVHGTFSNGFLFEVSSQIPMTKTAHSFA